MAAFSVLAADTPLLPDALPALQVLHYRGTGPHIYTRARLSVLHKALHLSLSAFERAPGAGSCIAFALSGKEAGGPFLFAQLSPQDVSLHCWGGWPASFPFPPQPEARPPEPLSPKRFAGVDEQGWFWGAELALEERLLAGAHISTAPGAAFWGALYKYNLDDSGTLGSSGALPGPGTGPETPRLMPFLVAN